MKIVEVKALAFDEVKVIRYARFHDDRGYFTESYQLKEFSTNGQLAPIFDGKTFVQQNESYSKAHVVRGLHMQWAPPQSKLVRTVWGHMIDIIVDIRPNSPTFGQGIMYDMPAEPAADYGELIWVPYGFAHGNYYTTESKIEYLVDAPWGGVEGEGSVSPLAADIDWSLCDATLLDGFRSLTQSNGILITDKDRNGLTMSQWSESVTSKIFTS